MMKRLLNEKHWSFAPQCNAQSTYHFSDFFKFYFKKF